MEKATEQVSGAQGDPQIRQALEELRWRVTQATAKGARLQIRGSGSKDWYGQELQGDVLDTRAYRGIVDYDPTELVITVRCGTPLAEVEAALFERRQMLAFEPPAFGPDATIGGMVASGLSGPRRAAVGSARDFVLGAVLMDGQGEVMRFGGQVMKNVAGYDVSRLLTGSLGILGVILEVSLKVLPMPMAEQTLRFEFSEQEAIEKVNQWAGQPLPVSATAWHGGMLMVRLSGAPAGVEAAQRRLGGEEVPEGASFWQALREQQDAFFQDAPALWRLSVPSTTPPLQLSGEQIVEWGGAQRWLRSDAGTGHIRQVAAQAGGHATLFRGGNKSLGVFHPLAPAVAAIHQRLKSSFDPAGIFNRGRMYSDL